MEVLDSQIIIFSKYSYSKKSLRVKFKVRSKFEFSFEKSHLLSGLLDCWIVGLLDCWIVGLLDCWIVRFLKKSFRVSELQIFIFSTSNFQLLFQPRFPFSLIQCSYVEDVLEVFRR